MVANLTDLITILTFMLYLVEGKVRKEIVEEKRKNRLFGKREKKREEKSGGKKN